MNTRMTCDVVIVGAGMVGAACALYASRAGLRAVLVDRGPVAGGTTDCLVVVNDRPSRRACLTASAPGDAIRTQRGDGHDELTD
uniref:FAD-dependent oxidoreductase n=1 Tax=Streptomyces lunaelactis TaxID=1535768 RepID=UPI00281647BF|nr:FAD-dependent oxidoreductase [Streptomyces lunaelactis]